MFISEIDNAYRADLDNFNVKDKSFFKSCVDIADKRDGFLAERLS